MDASNESEDQRAFFLHERDARERWADFYSLHYNRRSKWGEIALEDVRPKAGGGMLWGRGDTVCRRGGGR